MDKEVTKLDTATAIQMALLHQTTAQILAETQAIRREHKEHAEKDETKFNDLTARCVELEVDIAKTNTNLAWTQRIGTFVIAGLGTVFGFKVKG